MTDLPNWFEMTARRNFDTYLKHLRGYPGLKVLQIGAFAGHASEWLLENVLTGVGSELVDVDTWAGSPEEAHEQLDWNEVYQAYLDRIEPYSARVHVCKTTSDEWFADNDDQFDVIYVDGNHTRDQVLRDAVNAHRSLRIGGILIFDDYTWGHPAMEGGRPHEAINEFFATHGNWYDLLARNSQFVLRRRSAPKEERRWWRSE